MDIFIKNKPYTGKIQAVILDWAGTTVDYGSIGPVAVFINVFKKIGISVSVKEARQFMGLMKKDHVRGLFGLASIKAQWERLQGRLPQESDINVLYEETERMMLGNISEHASLIPGLPETVHQLRKAGIKIGTSTGYTSSMMNILVPAAARQGYRPDTIVCASDVPAGRPYPWMCYRNAIDMQVYPMEAIVKVGDTVSDIEEGLNAGMWTVGITQTGNELGLGMEDVEKMPLEELEARLTKIEKKFLKTGADYIINGIWNLFQVIETINERLATGSLPNLWLQE